VGSRPVGFTYRQRGQDVVISHVGRRATVLRGRTAVEFLAEVELGDAQELMARLTVTTGVATSGTPASIRATVSADRPDGPVLGCVRTFT
jgi:hypothetical protein